MRGVERVFHVAGLTSLRASADRVFAVNVGGTRIVLEEALRAGVERVVHTSSVAAVGPAARGSTADEDQVFRAGRYGLPYVNAKHEAELEAMRLAAHGLPVVVVNPAHVFGAGDRHRSSTELVRRFLRGQIPAYVDGALNIVDAEDVARGHLLADERGEVGRALHPRQPQLHPRPPLRRPRAGCPASSRRRSSCRWRPRSRSRAAAELAPGRPAVTTVEVRASSLWWAFRSTKAKRELGWRPAHHEDTLQTTIDWYRRARARAPEGSRRAPAARAARRGPRPADRRRAAAERRAVSATLHRCRTPTDWLCPCGRVARELRRRGVDYEEVRVAWRRRDRPEIEKLSGQRHVPLLVIEKDAICDSLRIIENLDWRQSEHS